MIFLISMLIAIVFVTFFDKAIKVRSTLFYILFTAIALIVLLCKINNVTFLPGFFGTYIYPVFDKAALGTAFFVLVMYANVFPAGSKPIKKLMPIRGEMSILACILTLGHNAAYGKTYFVCVFQKGSSLPSWQLSASLCSAIMILIMLPLFVTSFKCIRKKMTPKKWKQLQRAAYVFYALLYIHVLLVNSMGFSHGISRNRWNVVIYSIVFINYLVLRILKAYSMKHKSYCLKTVEQITGIAITLLCFVYLGITLFKNSNPNAISTKEANTPPVPLADTIEETADTITYQDGEYRATAFGYSGDIEVIVTIKNGDVISVTLGEYGDDPSYKSYSDKMISSIEENPFKDVDTISGATFSSTAILKAYHAALEKAAN